MYIPLSESAKLVAEDLPLNSVVIMPRLSSLFPALLALILGLYLRPLLSPSSTILTAPSSELSSKPFLEAVSHRRSVYTLSNSSTIPDSHLLSILEDALEKTPAAFGSFTTRLVLLLRDEPASAAAEKKSTVDTKGGGAQVRMWDLVEKVLRAKFDEKGGDEKDWEATRQKIDGFRGAYGTVSAIRSFSSNYRLASHHLSWNLSLTDNAVYTYILTIDWFYRAGLLCCQT